LFSRSSEKLRVQKEDEILSAGPERHSVIHHLTTDFLSLLLLKKRWHGNCSMENADETCNTAVLILSAMFYADF